MDSKDLNNSLKNIFRLAHAVNWNDFKYAIGRLEKDRDSLVKRFAKYKIGDKVILKKAPVITEQINYGWYGYRNILVKGAKGLVKEIEVRDGYFYYGLSFSKSALFFFNEDMLKAVRRGDGVV